MPFIPFETQAEQKPKVNGTQPSTGFQPFTSQPSQVIQKSEQVLGRPLTEEGKAKAEQLSGMPTEAERNLLIRAHKGQEIFENELMQASPAIQEAVRKNQARFQAGEMQPEQVEQLPGGLKGLGIEALQRGKQAAIGTYEAAKEGLGTIKEGGEALGTAMFEEGLTPAERVREVGRAAIKTGAGAIETGFAPLVGVIESSPELKNVIADVAETGTEQAVNFFQGLDEDTQQKIVGFKQNLDSYIPQEDQGLILRGFIDTLGLKGAKAAKPAITGAMEAGAQELKTGAKIAGQELKTGLKKAGEVIESEAKNILEPTLEAGTKGLQKAEDIAKIDIADAYKSGKDFVKEFQATKDIENIAETLIPKLSITEAKDAVLGNGLVQAQRKGFFGRLFGKERKITPTERLNNVAKTVKEEIPDFNKLDITESVPKIKESIGRISNELKPELESVRISKNQFNESVVNGMEEVLDDIMLEVSPKARTAQKKFLKLINDFSDNWKGNKKITLEDVRALRESVDKITPDAVKNATSQSSGDLLIAKENWLANRNKLNQLLFEIGDETIGEGVIKNAFKKMNNLYTAEDSLLSHINATTLVGKSGKLSKEQIKKLLKILGVAGGAGFIGSQF